MNKASNQTFHPIKGYEGFYEINYCGIIRSITRKVRHTHPPRAGIIRKPIKAKSQGQYTGYMCMRLHKGGIAKIHTIHHLVAIQFLPNPENRPIVRHKDWDKTNNHADNLEWVTSKEKIAHDRLVGINNRGRRVKPVQQLHKVTDEVLDTFTSTLEASKHTGISSGNIYSVCRGASKTAGGFKWRFAVNTSI